MVRIVQGAFNAGILSEGMYSRNDTEKFQKGLKDAVNVQVRPQGGVQNRAGTTGASRHDTSGATAYQWLVPFAFSTVQTYQLEFSEDVVRVLRNGSYVLDTATGAKSLASVTTAAEADLTLTTAGDSADFAVGDLLYLDDSAGTHKLDAAILKVVSISGATVGFSVFDGTRLDTTTGSWGTLDATATVQKVYSFEHPYDLIDMPDVRFAQDADTMYLAHPLYAPRKIGRTDHDDWSITAITFVPTIPVVTGVSSTATQGPDVTTTQDYDYVVSAIADETFEEGLPSAVTTVANDLFFKGSYNTITWSAATGASRYAVYRKEAGSFGFIGTTTDLTFKDENITPDPSRGVRIDRNPFAAPGDYPAVVAFYEQRLAYGATINDPQLVEMSRIDSIENFSNTFPALPDDAFRFRIRDSRVNRVRAFVAADSFVILTSGGEWEIAAQGDGEYLRPDKRKLAPMTKYGSADMEPLYTGNVILYVEPSGNVVRDYRPNDKDTPPGDLTVLAKDLFEDRYVTSWAYAQAPDKAVWVSLDDGALLSMTYMPEHDVWAWTRHEIGGAGKVRQVSVTREFNRDVLYIVVSRGEGASEVTVVERLAEREDIDVKKSYFVDGGYYDIFDTDQDEFNGLLHLRGLEVVALVDGDVVDGLVVDETGTVSFGDKAGKEISVGLPYESLIQTLGVQFEVQGLGSTEGRFKATSEIAIKLRRSRGIEAGTDLTRMNPLKEWDATMVGGPIPLKTHTPLLHVSGDWVRDATTYIRQRNPLPMGVLSIGPEWEVGE